MGNNIDIDIQISQDAIIFTEKMDELVRCVIEKTLSMRRFRL